MCSSCHQTKGVTALKEAPKHWRQSVTWPHPYLPYRQTPGFAAAYCQLLDVRTLLAMYSYVISVELFVVVFRVTTFLEVSGNLTAVGELTKYREMSGGNLARENCPWLTLSFGLGQCLIDCFGFTLILKTVFSLLSHFWTFWSNVYSVLVALTKRNAWNE